MDEQAGTGNGGISDERIRERAYEISLGENGGTPEENWRRAETELRSEPSSSSSTEASDGSAAPMARDEPSEDLPGAASP
jgi:hypothetical protein